MNLNLKQYEFNKENKSLLLNFIKKANQSKGNPYNNITTYNNLSKVIPVADILDKYPEESEIIDILDSDEDQIHEEEVNTAITQTPQIAVPLELLNKTVALDISDAIKEVLQTKKSLTSTILSDLKDPTLDLFNIFQELFDELGFKETVDLGILLSSEDAIGDSIILAYVKHMLIKQLTSEYSDQLQDILNKLCITHLEILLEEVTNFLLNTTDNYSKVTLQFIAGLSPDFKLTLLRNFVSHCKHLEESHISLLDLLLEGKVENHTLNCLVELMAKSAETMTTSKAFGKFLLNFIQITEKNISALEKPISHIIGSHKSIWKAKIQKTFDEIVHDSMLMSQSLR